MKSQLEGITATVKAIEANMKRNLSEVERSIAAIAFSDGSMFGAALLHDEAKHILETERGVYVGGAK